MITSRQSLDFLKTLEVPSGGSYRCDCPECGGENTLSITNEFGTLRYNCFRASCKFHGNINGEMNVVEIGNFLLSVGGSATNRDCTDWTIPSHFIRGFSNADCLVYLRNFHSLEAYQDGRIDIRYDPKLNRCVFLIKDGDDVKGAVGRALDARTKPKWYIYHSANQVPSVVSSIRDRNAAILVEDCCSAAAVSRVADGIALLGTNLFDAYIPYLVKYDTIYVALDKDASSKSIDIQRQLAFYCKDVRVVFLEKDLKYFSDQEIKEWHYNLVI